MSLFDEICSKCGSASGSFDLSTKQFKCSKCGNSGRGKLKEDDTDIINFNQNLIKNYNPLKPPDKISTNKQDIQLLFNTQTKVIKKKHINILFDENYK